MDFLSKTLVQQTHCMLQPRSLTEKHHIEVWTIFGLQLSKKKQKELSQRGAASEI